MKIFPIFLAFLAFFLSIGKNLPQKAGRKTAQVRLVPHEGTAGTIGGESGFHHRTAERRKSLQAPQAAIFFREDGSLPLIGQHPAQVEDAVDRVLRKILPGAFGVPKMLSR